MEGIGLGWGQQLPAYRQYIEAGSVSSLYARHRTPWGNTGYLRAGVLFLHDVSLKTCGYHVKVAFKYGSSLGVFSDQRRRKNLALRLAQERGFMGKRDRKDRHVDTHQNISVSFAGVVEVFLTSIVAGGICSYLWVRWESPVGCGSDFGWKELLWA